ncbi:hypothetical protein AGMMS49531_10140 [Endomicrobiia bacterium]|nr:hypothetical protein AGMMS49531_10140 [Endomicrobiia bacterium]
MRKDSDDFIADRFKALASVKIDEFIAVVEFGIGEFGDGLEKGLNTWRPS